MKKPILITGCQRSGTTLMGLILDSHSRISCIDENNFHYPSINTYLNAPSPVTFIAFKLPQYAAMFSFIKSHPELPIIWCIRSPMDTVLSMINLKIALKDGLSVSWAAHPVCAQTEIINCYWSLDAISRRQLSRLMARLSTIVKKHPAERSRSDMLFTAALCWNIKNLLPYQYTKYGIGYYACQYEKLVSSPETEIRVVLDHIGVDWNDSVLRHHEIHTGTSIGNTDNTRKIDARGVNQGIRNLSDEEVASIWSICGEVAVRWGYTQ